MDARVLLSVNAGDSLPIYRQIAEQVKGAVAAGILSPGDKLPSHRDLSGDLVVAPLTVKKAYDTLEAEGVVRTERGRGTFIAARGLEASGEATVALGVRARALVLQARVMGLSRKDALAAVKEAWTELVTELARAGAER